MKFLPISDIDDQEIVEELSKATGGLFEINDDASATRILLRIAAKEAAVETLDAQYRAMRESLTKDLSQFKAWSEPQLEHFARQQIEAGGNKTKTVKTMGGNLSLRTVAESWSVADADAAMQAAKEHCPEAITMQPVLDKKLLVEKAKTLLETNGELLPGIERKPERESFSIKFAKKSEAT